MLRRLLTLLMGCVVMAIILTKIWHRPTAAEDGREFLPLIREAGRLFDVDPFLIQAVCWRESRFRPHVSGQHGERGLMQVTEEAAAHWVKSQNIEAFHPEDLFDPRINILAGTYYLRWNLRQWNHTDNPTPYALAAYNAGPKKVKQWAQGPAAVRAEAFLEAISYPMTRRYVEEVMARRDLYRRLAQR